jgi:hypothetical protein
MIERFLAFMGSLDQDRQVTFHLFLTNQVGQQLGTQSLVKAVVGFWFRIKDPSRQVSHGSIIPRALETSLKTMNAIIIKFLINGTGVHDRSS